MRYELYNCGCNQLKSNNTSLEKTLAYSSNLSVTWQKSPLLMQERISFLWLILMAW